MSLNQRIVKFAHLNGYRVREDGSVVAPSGRARKCCADKKGYLSTSITIDKLIGRKTSCRRLMVHQLAAYQKFGDAAFEHGIMVRHLNGIPSDNRKENIAIGTASDNMMDMPKSERVRKAQKAGRGKRKMSDEEIERAASLREKGWYLKKIGAALGKSQYCVRRALRNRKVVA